MASESENALALVHPRVFGGVLQEECMVSPYKVDHVLQQYYGKR